MVPSRVPLRVLPLWVQFEGAKDSILVLFPRKYAPKSSKSLFCCCMVLPRLQYSWGSMLVSGKPTPQIPIPKPLRPHSRFRVYRVFGELGRSRYTHLGFIGFRV